MAARLGSAAFGAVLASIDDRSITIEALVYQDYVRVRELCRQYDDLPLGFVDTSLVAIAERLEIRRVATLDRRHVSVVRPQHASSFELLPEC